VDLVRPYRCLNVILSHYHLDHIVGLAYLSGVWKQGTVEYLRPEGPLSKLMLFKTLSRFLAPPHFPVSLENFPIPIEIVP